MALFKSIRYHVIMSSQSQNARMIRIHVSEHIAQKAHTESLSLTVYMEVLQVLSDGRLLMFIHDHSDNLHRHSPRFARAACAASRQAECSRLLADGQRPCITMVFNVIGIIDNQHVWAVVEQPEGTLSVLNDSFFVARLGDLDTLLRGNHQDSPHGA